MDENDGIDVCMNVGMKKNREKCVFVVLVVDTDSTWLNSRMC